METLKKIVTNPYFPAAAVLAAVLLFWAVGLLGGLSLLHNNQPPLATLTWMLFVYGAAVLTPLAGALAAVDLLRRWRRDRAAAAASRTADDGTLQGASVQAQPADFVFDVEVLDVEATGPRQEQHPVQPAPSAKAATSTKPAAKKPGTKKPAAKKAGAKKAA